MDYEVKAYTVTLQGRQYQIPERMMYGILAYVREHRRPGQFLTSIIENDLREAVGRADDENIRLIPAYVAYFYNEAPASCWGSPKRMKEWLKKD